MSEREAESTLDPSQRLLQAQEFAPRLLDPRVVELGKLVAGRMSPELVPMGFVMTSAFCIEDFRRGTDGFTQKPIESALVRQPDYVYDYLYLNIPNLARIAFSESFADEVRTNLATFLTRAGLEEDDYVLSPITTIEQAQTDIIDNAKKKVLGLDWAHFGLEEKKEEIDQLYDASYGLILGNSGMNFPLNILRQDHFQEANILKDIAPERKKTVVAEYTLAMLKDRFDIEEATFIRDWLFIKAPEAVATMHKLSPEEVFEYFMESDRSFQKAGLRARYYLTNLRQ